MVDAIIGKWKSDPQKTTGFDAFRQASGKADKWSAQPESVTVDIRKMATEWTVVTQREGKPAHTISFKEGEKQTTKAPDGSEIEMMGRVEGDKWIAVVKNNVGEVKSVTHVVNGELVQEQTTKGATLINRFKRL